MGQVVELGSEICERLKLEGNADRIAGKMTLLVIEGGKIAEEISNLELIDATENEAKLLESCKSRLYLVLGDCMEKLEELDAALNKVEKALEEKIDQLPDGINVELCITNNEKPPSEENIVILLKGKRCGPVFAANDFFTPFLASS